MRQKEKFALLARLIISLFFVFILIKYDFISINLTKKLGSSPYFIPSFILIFLSFFFGTFRWIFAIQTIEGKMNKLKLFMINHMSNFFGLILPGAVFVDAFKIYLLKKEKEELRVENLIIVSLYDRFIGLFTISLFCLIGSIVFYSEIMSGSTTLLLLLKMNLFVFIGLLAVLIFSSVEILNRYALNIIQKIKFTKIRTILENLFIAGKQLSLKTPLLLVLSSFSQAFGLASFYYIAKGIEHLALIHILTIVPMGFVTMHIPLTPNGLGTTHLSFDELFQLFGISSGADIFNYYFILYATLQITGLVSFLILRKQRN